MRRREFLMTIALVTVTLVSVNASPARDSTYACGDAQVAASEGEIKEVAEASSIEMLSTAPSPLIAEDKTVAAAYFNTLSILSKANDCSLFFGGPAAAIQVFKQLISKVQKDHLTTPVGIQVGIQMSGETVNVSDVTTKTEYRLFDRVSINANGPFYRKLYLSNAPLRPIGTFEPNTNEARVLMFLHELGHVMKGDDGKWLLPNDGKDGHISRRNSQKVEDVCGEQIRALPKREGKGDAQMTLAGKTDNAVPTKREAAPPPTTSAHIKLTRIGEPSKN